MIFSKSKHLILLSFIILFLSSCQEKEPSILKVYVRSTEGVLVKGASVRIVGDLSQDTPEYFDQKKTNESGIALFNLDGLFEEYDKKQAKVAYFNIYAKDTSDIFTVSQVRAKAHLTSTASITLKN